jgi:hypothetical protein
LKNGYEGAIANFGKKSGVFAAELHISNVKQRVAQIEIS